MADFKLSAQLLGHESDVRAVSFPSADVIFTASRDCTVRMWRRTQNVLPSSFQGHLISRGSEYINSLTHIPPTTKYHDGLVASGGKDTIIEIKPPHSSPTDNAERLLIGHSHNVCALDISAKGTYLVSGGWDGQARVWNLATWETESILGGHGGMAVWSVIALDDSTVVTGCADKNIRIFDLKQSVAGEIMPRQTIYTPDIVRALCKIPEGHSSGAGIASASNDGTLRLWSLDGVQLGELHGHESFIYSLAALPSGELVSSGEDRTVRVWKGLECIQTITHPAISVWAVAVNQSTGDIVSGASDGVARVFTRRPECVADQETLRQYQDAVQSSSIPQQQLGDINKERLPGPEFLGAKSGTKDGQVQMIREENGNITAYQWSKSQQHWISVGTVVDAVGSTGKKVEYNGKSFDYVFDVDIEDGKPPLKLPYNLSENPYDRARRFLGDNELPLSYLDNVANFITENTKGAVLGQPAGHGGPDPYGTESRYRPGEPPQLQASKVLPQSEYLNILGAKYEAMFNKIITMNKHMVSAGSKEAALNPGEEHVLQTLREAVESSKAIPPGSLNLIVRIVTQWPYPDRLPGLDLLRCVARYPAAAQFSDHKHGSLLELAIDSCAPADTTPNENAVMMGARVIANLFGSADGRSLVSLQADRALLFLERLTGVTGDEPIGKLNQNVRIAVTTAALNFSVMVNKEKLLRPNQRRRLVSILGATLKREDHPEVIYRGMVALGTIVATSKDELTGLDVSAWIQEAASNSTELRVKAVADECKTLLSQ